MRVKRITGICLSFIVAFIAISGCGLQSSYIKMAENHAAISPEEVKVFDNETKPANYEVLGKINIHAIQDEVGTKWWQPELRKKAAAVGANGVVIEQMGSTGGFGRGYLDVIGIAIVYDEKAPAQTSHYSRLKELKELLDIGAITQEEYDAEKKKILNP